MNRFTDPATATAIAPTPATTTATVTDVHQHLWPTPLLEALRGRSKPPRLRGWTLALSDEPDYELDPDQHEPWLRAVEARADGLDLVLISMSSPLGIELLAAEEAEELLAAYHEGALSLPPPFRAWAAASVRDPDPTALSRRLDQGFVGLQLPATALLGDRGYARVASLLAVLEDSGKPLFIHPGPAAFAEEHLSHSPPWWPAVVDYPRQMHAAWYAFRAFGRPRHPRLRVCFAMLAGLAPLHGERFAARAGERSVVDEQVFLEASSYGTRAVDATVRVLGVDVLVNGSDRPYAKPVTPELGAAALFAMRCTNPLRLLDLKEVSDGLAVSAGAQS